MTRTHERMPSLTAVRAFEAAARLGSFTLAGRELFVTQSAVSRQVQALEVELGVALFRRTGRRIALTPEGQEFAEAAGRALDRIREAAARLRRPRLGHVVTISMLPSLAAKWLTPRLSRLLADFPGLDLRLSASRALVDFDRDGVDCAIRYGRGPWPGTRSELLMRESVFPVAAPRLANSLGLRTVTDLPRARLLRGDIPDDWHAWFAAAGLGQPTPESLGPYFTDHVTLIEAAADGVGVALARSLLVQRELKEGRLVRIGGWAMDAAYAYHFVTPDRDMPSHVAGLLTWFREEVSRTGGEDRSAG